jgi:hypothetical protein
MAAITDVSVTGSKLLTPKGDLVTISKIRIEKIGTTGYRIYGARLKNIVGSDAVAGKDTHFMSATGTQLVSVDGGFYLSAADMTAFEAALDTLLES